MHHGEKELKAELEAVRCRLKKKVLALLSKGALEDMRLRSSRTHRGGGRGTREAAVPITHTQRTCPSRSPQAKSPERAGGDSLQGGSRGQAQALPSVSNHPSISPRGPGLLS